MHDTNDDLVSVIITTYKRPSPILYRAIKSVINQTYKNIELIIINDYPDFVFEQSIRTMIDKIDVPYIKYIVNQENIGACASRNIGIRKAKGKYIAFLDDDDEWERNKIEVMIQYFSEGIGIVYCSYNIYRENKLMKKIGDGSSGKIFERLLESNVIGGCSIPIIKKECFDQCGLFDVAFPSAQDLDMWIRIALKYDVAYVDESLVKYYVMDQSITRSIDKRVIGWLMILDKYSIYYDKHPKIKNRFFNIIIIELLAHGKFKKGINEYIKEYKNRPTLCIRYSLCIIKGLLKYILTNKRGYV